VKIPYHLPQIKQYLSLPPETLVAYAPILGVPKLRDLWEQWVIYKGTKRSNLPSGAIDVSNKITKPAIFTRITDGIFLVTRLFVGPGEILLCCSDIREINLRYLR
jgi:hypothetical protein